ncbi:GNAT family N-acetyltransferase [Burkholderia vietnamiensis]|uniref:GNAT family N-acetyltransferase n=1 Tax=Burkholderia vietnamiensis TaxID=60552 RepID=UPI001B9E80F4|nr:GNAT family N-acetyltransferase [Burkholderia vietnamiensis]MBR8036433.1 GNAT family N-acetyltransferase [Burkholderia vietnamiensis]
MEIEIREATLKDLKFMRQIYEEGVGGGHFVPQPGISVDRMLQEWVTRKMMVRQAVRLDGFYTEAIPLNLLIAELDGVSAGFLISSPETPEALSSIEMYVLGVAKFARRRGVATSLIEYEEQRYSSETSFYTRCFIKSSWAISLFQKLGYRIERISPNTKMHYLRKP